MTATIQSREVARDKWATLMETALVTGGIIDAVYGYQVKEMGGKASVLVITSDGTDRSTGTFDPTPIAIQYFSFHLFVRYAKGDWTEANSEDFLDTFEKKVSEVIVDYCDRIGEKDPEWTRTWFDGPSEPDVFIDIEGREYRHEMIRIACEVYNSA